MASNCNIPLPSGFKVIFDPTDEQIIFNYLLNKVLGKRLPSNEVIECDLYGECHAWKKLFEESGRNVMYFFTRLKKKTSKSSRIERVTECGTWRSQSDMKIYCGGPQKLHIGSKRNFSFVPKKGGGGDDLKGWVMHEYRLDGFLLRKKVNNNDNGYYNSNSNYMEDYVLCRVKRRVKKSDHVSDHRVENFENDMVPMAVAAPPMMMMMIEQEEEEEEACNNVTAAATNYGDAANSGRLTTHCSDMSDSANMGISIEELDDLNVTSYRDLINADDHHDDIMRVGIQEVLATVSFNTNSIIQQHHHYQQQQQLKLSSNTRAAAVADNGTVRATGSAGLDSDANNDCNNGKEKGGYLQDAIRLPSASISGSMSLFFRNH